MSVRGFFRQSFDLLVSTLQQDSGGAAYYSFTKARTFKGRLQLLQDRRRVMSNSGKIVNERSTPFATHRLYCAEDLHINLTDRIMFGASCFEIITINLIHRASHMEIDLKLLTL